MKSLNRQTINRRTLLKFIPASLLVGGGLVSVKSLLAGNSKTATKEPIMSTIEQLKSLPRNPLSVSPIQLKDADWDKLLEDAQYTVLRKEGTERAFTSPLNNEKRDGEFVCAGCGLALFTSEMKYDSGTGWPSFFDAIEGRILKTAQNQQGFATVITA